MFANYPRHYGLKQVPRVWFEQLRKVLVLWSFSNAKSDISLLVYRKKHDNIILLVYVDDILVTVNNKKLMAEFIKKLNRTFSLKDLGPIHYFLGLEVHRDSTIMHLSQTRYVLELLKIFNLVDASPCPTSMIAGKTLSAFDGDLIKNPLNYKCCGCSTILN